MIDDEDRELIFRLLALLILAFVGIIAAAAIAGFAVSVFQTASHL